MGKIAVRFDDRRKARSCIRFVSDRAWDMVSHLFPAPAEIGRPRKWPTRTLFEAALYVLRTGTQWRFLPDKFPPFSTVQRHFYAWRDAGLFELINHVMVFFDRQRAGRECQPTGAIIDSQSVKTTVTGGLVGYDAGKKINGMKRHILVDVEGRLLMALVTPADWHDSRAGALLLKASRRHWPFVAKLWADKGYAGRYVGGATPIDVEIVTGPKNQVGFIVQKRRWVVERTISWINVNRRLAKDYERHASTALAFLVLAAALVLLQRA